MRLRAVARLRESDADTLVALALDDPSPAVRLAAAGRLLTSTRTDAPRNAAAQRLPDSLLAELRTSSSDSHVRDTALSGLLHRLCERLASPGPTTGERHAFSIRSRNAAEAWVSHEALQRVPRTEASAFVLHPDNTRLLAELSARLQRAYDALADELVALGFTSPLSCKNCHQPVVPRWVPLFHQQELRTAGVSSLVHYNPGNYRVTSVLESLEFGLRCPSCDQTASVLEPASIVALCGLA